MEVPLLESVQFSLPIPGLVGGGTSTISGVSVDPLLPEHREKHCRERGCQTRVKQTLDNDDLWRRTGPVDGAGVRVGEE